MLGHSLEKKTFILIAIIGLAGSVDLIQDVAEGVPLIHLWTEMIVVGAAISLLVMLAIESRRLESSNRTLSASLSKVSAESSSWRAKTALHVQGLSDEIDKQLTKWNLSTAEQEIALLILKGLSLKEVALLRNTSERTVRQQAQSIYQKAGLAGRIELSAFFLEDLLTPSIRVSPERREYAG